MRVIEGENELRLTCSRSASGGIALLRCETQDDIVRLPDEIDGVPVTEVGAYVLSERAPDLTGKDTFAVRITCGGTEPKHNAAAIRTVTLPKDAKSVGSYAFYNCRNLERIELTDSVSEFGGGAPAGNGERVDGVVKFFNGQKGFGFIQREDGGPDAFVHISAVERAGMAGLDEGQRVSFELELDRRGKQAAINLTPL